MWEAKFIDNVLNVILISPAGTRFADKTLAKHHEFFRQHVIEKPRSYYRYGDNLKPDELSVYLDKWI